MTDKSIQHQALMAAAVEAREFSYSPYSGYRVGAALLGADGNIYTGCNVENAGYTPTNCAERTAVFKAVSEGVREFCAIAVVGGSGETLDAACTPCGVCRQVMTEFCGPDFQIHMTDGTGSITTLSLKEMMPLSFSGSEHLL